MKTISFLLLYSISVFFFPAHAKTPQHDSTQLNSSTHRPYWYASIGLGDRLCNRTDLSLLTLFNNIQLGAAVTYITSKNYGLSLSYQSLRKDARDIPSNYNSWKIFYTPYDQLKIYSLRGVKDFPFKAEGIRFSIEAGFDLVGVNYDQFTYVKHPPSTSYISFFSDYHYDDMLNPHPAWYSGLSARLKLTGTSRFIGFEEALYVNWNTVLPVCGIEVRVCFGRLKDKKMKR